MTGSADPTKKPNIPIIACTLDPTNLDQRKGLLWKIINKATARTQTPDGYEFQFNPEPTTLSDLAQLITLEQKCCPFLRFVLTVEPANGPIRLHLTGPEGTKDFLASILIK